MKGSLWELAPIVIAAAVAFGLALGRRRAPAAPVPASVPAVPAVSSAPVRSVPLRPQDAKPDGRSAPDPTVPPDPTAGPDSAAPADPRR